MLAPPRTESPEREGGPALSVVVPMFDEARNVAPLVRETAAVLRPRPFELIAVDDGSRDATLRELRRLLSEVPELRIVALRRNFGQTLAIQAGLDQARGAVIVTMDGDLQNDPRDILRLVERIEEGADVVTGWRRRRRDPFLLRRVPSWAANRLIRAVTGVPIHDHGCGLKAYRREVVRGLSLYADMHRFAALMTLPLGVRLDEIEVAHRPRLAGASKYGLWRTVQVLADIVKLQMLTRFQESPLRGFVVAGLPFLLAGLGSAVLAVASWSALIVWPTVSLLLGLNFVWCLFAGLLGEAIVDTAGRERPPRSVGVREWRAG